MFDMAIVPEERIADNLPAVWNSLEHHDESTRLLHYTVVPTQPWLSTQNPLERIWLDAFVDAVADNAVPRAEVERLVAGRGRRDLLDMYDQASTQPEPVYRNVAEVALIATLGELEQERARRLQHKVWHLSRRFLHRSGPIEKPLRLARATLGRLRSKLRR